MEKAIDPWNSDCPDKKEVLQFIKKSKFYPNTIDFEDYDKVISILALRCSSYDLIKGINGCPGVEYAPNPQRNNNPLFVKLQISRIIYCISDILHKNKCSNNYTDDYLTSGRLEIEDCSQESINNAVSEYFDGKREFCIKPVMDAFWNILSYNSREKYNEDRKYVTESLARILPVLVKMCEEYIITRDLDTK